MVGNFVQTMHFIYFSVVVVLLVFFFCSYVLLGVYIWEALADNWTMQSTRHFINVCNGSDTAEGFVQGCTWY